MSDYSSSSVLSAAAGQQDVAIQSLKSQFQAERQAAGLAAQAVQQPQPSGQQQPALNKNGPKGTQVNILV